MKYKEVKTINDFSDLFLSSYSIKKSDKEGNIYLSNNFLNIIQKVMNEENYEIVNKYKIYNEYGFFDINSFVKRIEYSNMKNGWADKFKFDMQKNSITTNIVLEKAREVYNLYSSYDKAIVNKVVDDYIYNEDLDMNYTVDNDESDYITLSLK